MTRDTGTIHDVLADINELSRNLTDRYKLRDGFPIFKELVQNADDADAELLRISWHQGFPQSSHRLLNGPGMLVLNDGATCHQDILNIRRLGMNYKAGERGAIGKFGLGLKSIFHLCEAFFYLAYDPNSDDPEVAQEPKVFIYNPWNGGSDENRFHSEWDLIHPEHVASLGQAVAPLRPKGRFFALWVPLRQHCHASDPIIRQFFGEKNNARAGYFPNHLIDRIARVLPMLSRLKRVEVWNSAGNRPEAFAEIEPEAERRHRDIDSVNEKPHHFRGKIRVVSLNPVRESNVSYFGVELKLPPSSVAKIADSDFWPRTRSRTQTGESRTAKAPADAHAAAVLVATNEAPSRLVIRHACYLPLASSDEGETRRLSSHVLHLHGRFFIDAGRQAIPGLDSDQRPSEPSNDEQVREAWNRRLFEHGSLPLLLKAIAKWSQSLSEGDTHQIEQITRQIEENDPLQLWNGAICRDEQWLYLLKPPTESNKALGNWTLKTAKAMVHEIPRPAASIALYDLLPEIAAVSSDRALTFAGWPRISANETTPWPPKVLAKVLDSLVPGVLFANNEHLEYFARFLEHCVRSEDQRIAVGEVLWPMLKNAFQDDSLTLQRIEELGDTLRRVLEFVPEEHRLVLSWADSGRRSADAIFRLIAKDECDLVPIPSSVRPTTGRDYKTIESRIVVRLLRTIGEVPLDNILLADVLLADVVGDLLKRADLERKTLWQSLNDVRLLVIYDCGRKQTMRKTWLELNEQKQRRLVFCDQAGLTQLLQAALGDAGSVWRIDPDFAAKVLDDKDAKHGFPGCSARECAAVLAPPRHGNAVHFGGAALGAWEARRELLKKLVGTLGTGASDDQERLKDACRLLIHGRSQDANFNAALFLAADRHFDALAEKLARHVVAKRQEEWRILIGEPAVWAVEDGLTTSQQKSLDLYPLAFSEPAVLNFLEKANPDHLNGIDLSKDEYATLLTNIETSRNELLKQLPIHPVSKGKQRIAIPSDDPPRFFWDDGYELDADLTESITLLALDRGRDKRVADRQRELAPVLDREQALRLALKSPQSEKHWLAILKAIEKSEERLPDDIVTDLCTKPWFPTRFGGKNRDELICLTVGGTDGAATMSEDFRQEMTRLVEACDGAFLPDWMLDDKFRKHLSESRKIACQRLHDWGVLPDKTQSLQKLSLLLAQGEQNCIGSVAHDHFEDWLNIDWDTSVMPAHQVLKAVADLVGHDVCFEHASADVRMPLKDHDRLIEILNWLAGWHEHTSFNKDLALRVFSNYFEMLIRSKGDLVPIGLEKLLAQSGKWQSPSKLCLSTADSTADFADHCQLHLDLAKLLNKSPSNLDRDDFEDQLNELDVNGNLTSTDDVDCSAQTVRDYFCPWEIKVQLPVIGGFLAVLCEDARFREYTERVLGKFRLNDIFDELVQQTDGQTVGPLTDRVISLKRTNFSIRVIAAETAKVRNILGGYFDAELNPRSDNLLLGFGHDDHVKTKRHGSRRDCSIRLRRIMVETKSQDELNRILCAATQRILIEAFSVPEKRAKTQAERVFAKLAQSDHLEITATQRLILSGAFVTWEQLGLSSDAAFGPKLAELQRCVSAPPQSGTSPKRGTEPHNGLEAAQRALQNLIEKDADAQTRSLVEVRRQIGDNNQYNHESVLFELAQNADDALLEANKEDPIRIFLHPYRIAIRHFGRKINQVPPENPSKDDPRSNDLWKMLTLWLTNKTNQHADLSQVKLTGKFGLGFKSVFLVSNNPRLLSGQLSCEIVGGVFPRYLNTTERECFDPYLTDLSIPEQKLAVTVIELPLIPRDNGQNEDVRVDEVVSKASRVDVKAIVDRFRGLAHLLVVFSQRIRRIEIEVVDEATRTTHTTQWKDEAVPGVSGCFKGTLHPLPDFLAAPAAVTLQSTDAFSPRRALVLRTRNHGGVLLLAHDGRRFQRLPNDVPTIWALAPIHAEEVRAGFALNARFSPDPGRARLGTATSKNNEIAADLGRDLGHSFVSLFNLSQRVGWPQFCRDIGLDNSASEYEFWDSLWELLGVGLLKLEDTAAADCILRTVFWGPNGAARRFFGECQVLPSRLEGIQFFALCRGRMNAPAEELTQWVLKASSKENRDSALRYLADGELGREVQRLLRQRPTGVAGTWLQGLNASPEFQSLSREQRVQLVGLLTVDEGKRFFETISDSNRSNCSRPVVSDPGEILRRIHAWWTREGHQHIKNYEKRTFPNGGLRFLTDGQRDEQFRTDWVTLFLLGLNHTMGRTVAEQHREFLRKCEHDGTLRMIASSEREPGAWMGWINDFLDRQLEDAKFLQWMKQFVGVYQVSRHLDDYIAAFEAVDSDAFKSRSFGLTEITNLRESHQFRGSDFDAPPLSRVLGMGQCFVLRELVRKGVITNKHAHRHCYVPSKRVRDLLMSLGCEGLGQSSRKWELSLHIHEFLVVHLGDEAATFQHCFDIPFQIIAEDEGLQAKFLQQTIAFKDDESDLWYPDVEAISGSA